MPLSTFDDEAEGDKQFPTESEIEPYVSGLVSKSCLRKALILRKSILISRS